MKGGPGAVASTILQRASMDPLRYLGWYLRKPMMLWSGRIMFSDGINFYPVAKSWLDTSPAMKAITIAMSFLHPSFVILALAAPLLMRFNSAPAGGRKERPSIIVLWLLLIHITLIFIVLTPMPRYSLPLWPLMYVLGIFTIYRVGQITKAFVVPPKRGSIGRSGY